MNARPLCVALALVATPIFAQQPDEEFQQRLDALRWSGGSIDLCDASGDAVAHLDLPSDYRFLGSKDASWVLTEAWGNPKGEAPLGMIFPSDQGPVDDASFGVVLSYVEDGHVLDDDAASIDYAELLTEMQQATRDSNAELVEQGYDECELVGWAAPPRYDASEHKLYWAKELRFGASTSHVLNYDVRALGRKGVLSMNAVGGIGDLARIDAAMRSLKSSVAFVDGQRYEDYDDGIDDLAAYGIGGLIAGKVALKVGFFKGIWIALLAAKKLVIVGVIALAAFAKKLLSRKRAAAS